MYVAVVHLTVAFFNNSSRMVFGDEGNNNANDDDDAGGLDDFAAEIAAYNASH